MRKTTTVTIDSQGRDHGKTFLLREMPASQAEKWAMRAFLGLAKSGATVPEGLSESGMAGIATLGFRALSGITFDLLEPLLDEMFECVSLIPDPSRPQVVRALIEDDIEEVGTRLRLRKEVFALHVDFSQAAALLKQATAAA